MDQLKKLYASIPPKQRFLILFLALAGGAAVVAFSNWQKERGFRPLYNSLAAEDAAAITQKLKETGVEYRLAENGTAILVPSEKVAQVRLDMAGAGLPKSGRIGFELFDKTNFGVTDFAEHINYRRALEGELERSVMSLSEVEQARVHVTFAKESIFVESRQAAKASVMVRLRAGAQLAPQNVIAITHLVASAVEGLAPESISVLDMRGNLLSRAKKIATGDSGEPSDAMIEFQHKIERDLTGKIVSTLEPVLGPDKFRVAVSVDCDFRSGEQSEETYDPQRTVIVNSQKTQDESGTGTAAGIPGTASNLPRPESTPAKSAAGYSRRTENVSYQASRTVRRMKLPQGTVTRQSVSVLVDHAVRWDGKPGQLQRVLVPPAPEKLKTIRDLVAGVVGLKQDRGDQLIVESLAFEGTSNAEPPGSQAPAGPVSSKEPASWLDKIKTDPKIWAGGAVALAVAVFVIFRLFKSNRQKAPHPTAASELPAPAKQPSGEAERHISGESRGGPPNLEAGGQRRLPAAGTPGVEALATQLREAVQKDPDLYAEVMHEWLAAERSR
jgi:flagellar M-ring protein FliF